MTALALSDAVDTSPLADELCPDVYFTGGYGSAAALLRGGAWHSARRDDRIMVPYVVNDLGDGRFDAVSPFGFSGIYAAADCPATDLARFWNELRHHWKAQGVVAVYFRFSPLDPGSTNAVRALAGLSLQRRNVTVTIEINEGLWEGLKGNCRNTVRKAQRAGLSGGIRPATADDLQREGPFRRLYTETMRRVGAATAYDFADEYYTELLGGLGQNLLLAQISRPDGQVVAASLVLAHGDRLHYHLAASSEAGLADGASNLLIWTILQWAAEHGRAVVHLGGGVRPDDSLFRFKSSFGGTRTEVWHGSTVVDDRAYHQLVTEHAARLGITSNELYDRSFFPAYRYGTGLI